MYTKLASHTHFHYMSIKAIIDHLNYKYIWNTGYEPTNNVYETLLQGGYGKKCATVRLYPTNLLWSESVLQ